MNQQSSKGKSSMMSLRFVYAVHTIIRAAHFLVKFQEEENTPLSWNVFQTEPVEAAAVMGKRQN